MNIVVDSGNTFSKIGWFEGEKLIRYTTHLEFPELLWNIRAELPEHLLFSSVGRTQEEFEEALGGAVRVMGLNPETPLPIIKNYDTTSVRGERTVGVGIAAPGATDNRRAEFSFVAEFDAAEEEAEQARFDDLFARLGEEEDEYVDDDQKKQS